MCGHNNQGVMVTTQDPSPPGIGLSPGWETFVEPCECVSKGFCPWCGSTLVGDLDDFSEHSDLRCGRENDDTCTWTWQMALDRASEPPETGYD